MGQKQAQRVRAVSGREQAVGATSKGLEWLDEARQELLAAGARRPTVAERERIVEAAEGRIEADLARRKEALGATSAGAALLREEYGDGGFAADARLQSFAEREAVRDQIEERVDEELEAQEGALRSIPLGKQYLWEAEQARPGGVEGSPPLAERESIVNTATERVEEEFDRREKRLAGVAGNENLLVEVAGGLDMAGGTLTLGERWRVLEAAARRLEEERAELEGKEAALLQDPAGAEFLRNAQLEMLGDADREANTLADRGRVIMAAAAALQKAAAKRQADQEWEKKKAAREQALARRPGGADLYHAHLADLDPQWGVNGNTTTTRENIDSALTAAESDGARQKRLRVVLSDEAATACYREVLDQVVGQFKTPDLDRALAAGEREQQRAARRAAALETATEAAQAAAARSNVKLRHAGVRAIYETGETHAAGLAAVERTTQALDDAANQRLPADTVIHTWNANRSDPGGIAAALDAATAAARREEELAAAAAARVSRLEQLFDKPASAEAFLAALDDEAPSWRTGTRPACIDRALDVAERGLGRRKAATWRHQQHELVLKAEQQFPGAPSAAWRDAGRSFSGQTAIDRHGESVSLMLSDRACARALATEGPSAEPEPARNLMQRVWLRTEVERQQLQALRARTEAARLAQRNHNAVRPVVEKSPPAPKRARLVPDATREDAVAAAPLIVRARLPEAEQQELRFGVDIVAKELAGEFGRYQWWSHAGGELEELHLREDRYLNYTKKGPVEIGMLRTVLERDVYGKAFLLVEHPVVEPEPPTNLVELVRPFIRWLQDAVDRLIDRVLDREPAHPSRPAAAADQVPARPAPQPPVAPTEPALGQPVPPAAAASPIVEPPAAPAGVSGIDVKPQLATTTNDEATAEPGRREASPPPATAPAPEPALNVTEAERVRVAVDAVKAKLPRTQPHSGNRSHRPPAVSDERFDHLAAATDDEFVKKVVTELQRRQAYYTDSERSESEETHLRPTITRKYDENLVAYEKADAARGFFSRRPPKPTRAAAESVAIEEFEAEQLVLIEGVCRNIQQWSPAAVRRELQPKQESTLHLSRSSSHTNEQDREDTSQSR